MRVMRSPLDYRFPGMDPWLEHRGVWPGVHDALIVDMARALTAQLQPRYVAWPAQRLVLELPERGAVPDITVIKHLREPRPRYHGAAIADPPVRLALEPSEVREGYIEIRSLHHHRKVVTVVEVLSLANKRAGTDSRAKYIRKQQEVLSSDVHLVEIDLLRAGLHTVAVPLEMIDGLGPHEYTVVVRRSDARDQAEVYPIRLRKRLPRIPIPVRKPDPDAVLELQPLLEAAYVAGACALGVDYGRPPDPPLSGKDGAWAERIARNTARSRRR